MDSRELMTNGRLFSNNFNYRHKSSTVVHIFWHFVSYFSRYTLPGVALHRQKINKCDVTRLGGVYVEAPWLRLHPR